MKRKLSHKSLISCLKKASEGILDKRNGGNLKYSIKDALFFAFSCFYFQQPSFLRHEENLKKKMYRKNISKLLDCSKLHSAQTCRDVLDSIAPLHLESAFDKVFSRLDRSGTLRELKFKEFGLLFSGDGVDYFYSEKVHCKNCYVCCHNKGTEKERVSYAHKAFVVNIVHPNQTTILPLQPEFIVPQDGHEKQDCERAAGKRWMEKWRKTHHLIKGTFLTDSLHCNQPFFSNAIDNQFHVIAPCTEGTNPYFMEWVEDARKGGEIQIIEERCKKKGKFHQRYYEFLQDVPLRDTKDALKVSYMSMTEIDPKGKEVKFEYATTHKITKENVIDGCLAARTYWKTENEGNNTLKNQGYRFDHNFGHGKQYLSSILASLLIFVYLIHSILEMTGQDPLSKLLELDTRLECFALMRSLVRACIFEDWNMLYFSMLQALQAS